MELNKTVRRGDIYWHENDSETDFSSPVIIVSHDTNNLYGDKVLVVPLTYSLENWLPTHCGISTSDMHYKAMCENIYTADRGRLLTYAGSCNVSEMEELDRCLSISLGLPEPPTGETMKERVELYSRIHDMELNYAAEKTRADTFEKLYNELLNLCVQQ